MKRLNKILKTYTYCCYLIIAMMSFSVSLVNANHISKKVTKFNIYTFAFVEDNIITPTGETTACRATGIKLDPITGTDMGADAVYTWEESTWSASSELGDQWTVIAGATSKDYAGKSWLGKTTLYRRKAIAMGFETISNEILVAIAFSPPSGNSISPVEQSVAPGGLPGLIDGTLPSGGDTHNFIYTWEQSPNSIEWSVIEGATEEDYQPEPLAQGEIYYRRKVTSPACLDPKDTPTSNTAKVVAKEPAIEDNTILRPLQAESCGEPSFDPAQIIGSLPSVPSGATIVYTWMTSDDGAGATWTEIPNSNTINYDPPALTKTTLYKRIVTAGDLRDESNVESITVSPNGIENNTVTGPTEVAPGAVPGLLVGSDMPVGFVPVYIWETSTNGMDNWMPADETTSTGNTSKDYQPGALTITTYFRRGVSSYYCPIVYNEPSHKIEVVTPPEAGSNTIIATGPITFCGTATPDIIEGNDVDNAVIYEWSSSINNMDWDLVTDDLTGNEGKGRDYHPSPFVEKTKYFRRLAKNAEDDLSGSVSNTIKMTLTPTEILDNEIISPPLNGSMESTVVIDASPVTGGNGNYTYLWKQSPTGQGDWEDAVGINSQEDYTVSSRVMDMYYRREVKSGNCESITDSYYVPFLPVLDIEITQTFSELDADGDKVPDDNTGDGIPEFAYNFEFVNNSSSVVNNIHIFNSYTNLVLVAGSDKASVNGDIEGDLFIIKDGVFTWDIPQMQPYQKYVGVIYVQPTSSKDICHTLTINIDEPEENLENNITEYCIEEYKVQKAIIEFPNLITPNGDGLNDCFMIAEIEGYSTNEIIIMDRWGNKVYQMKNYSNDNNCWNAEGLADGTFYYVFKASGEGKEQLVIKGFITVLRQN